MSNSRPIGIFDSGVGGLTVLKEVMRILPDEKIIYFGDTARVPYGPKSKETILKFSMENILFLLKHNVKLIIIACNTASSVALAVLEQNFKLPIIGVIKPGAQEAVRLTKNNRIGVIGTRTTIKSTAYKRRIKKIAPDIQVYSQACPLFVPLVEEGWLNTKITKDIVKSYLEPLKKQRIDTLVLGCTHYPLLKPVIKRVLGPNVHLVDSAKQVAKQAYYILKEASMLSDQRERFGPRVHFYVSDEPENFASLGRQFLGFGLKKVQKVSYV